MRVLVLTTASRFTPDVQLLVHLAAALAERGEVVGVACAHRSAIAGAVAAGWPRLSLRTFGAGGTTRQVSAVRGVVTALRPDAMLVGSERDAALASMAMGGRGGVVHRVSHRAGFSSTDAGAAAEAGTGAESRHTEAGPGGWRAALGRTRARVIEWGRRTPVVSWPEAPVSDAASATDSAPDPEAPEILVLPSVAEAANPLSYDQATATALRTIARLRRRHTTLRVTLLGDSAGDPVSLQVARVHAAALGLTKGLRIRSVQSLLSYRERSAMALWVAMPDDAGAICAVAAMRQGVPVVAPHRSVSAGLVTPEITGFLEQVSARPGATPSSPAQHPPTPVSLAAGLARLIGDSFVRRTMGEAAMSKAARDHAWDRFVDDAQLYLAKAAGGAAHDKARARARENARSAGVRS